MGLLVVLVTLSVLGAIVILLLLPWWLTLALIAIALLFLTGPFLRLINASLAEIELAHAAVVTRGGREIGPEEETLPSIIQEALGFTNWFGEREGGLLFGGRHFKWWFEDCRPFSLQNKTTGEVAIRFNTMSEDGKEAGPELTCKFPVQYRNDPRLYKDGKYLFFYVEEGKREQIIQEKLQSDVGGIGARYKPMQFVSNRQALTDIFNCKMRLSVSPHLLHVHEKHDSTSDKRHSKKYCGLGTKCPLKKEEQSCKFVERQTENGVEYVPDRYAFIHAKDLIRCFNLHQPAIRAILHGEEQDVGDHSRIELLTGSDIFEVPVTDIKFPPDIEKAFAQKLQLQKNREAFGEVLAMDDQLKDRGYSPQERADLIQTHTGQAQPRQVVSVEGGAQAVVVTGGLSNLFGGSKEKRDPDKRDPDKKDRKGGRS